MSCLLVVDDDAFSLDVIAEHLKDQSHELIFAEDGQQAWQQLTGAPNRFDAVILDRIMPVMNGMEVLQRCKADPLLKHLPVIMQTAANSPDDVTQGLAAGAWYYLSKPYSGDALRQIVAAALADRRSQNDLVRLSEEIQALLSMTASATYQFRTQDAGRRLASIVAHLCADESMVAMGLTELMLNAVEHGNLGISYADKSRLIREGLLIEEIERRLDDPDLKNRWAELEYRRESDCLRFTIRDQGKGFDWLNYLDMDPARAFDAHGRGIAMARQLAFSSIEYQGCGNEVVVKAMPSGRL
jgi:CheY-like chemotaxis protein/anti-sigma regulatory factor (Ser/Thr protein kinase)